MKYNSTLSRRTFFQWTRFPTKTVRLLECVRRQRHLRPLLLFPTFFSISIALLPRTLTDFYLLHTFAEEFMSVVCDSGHRVPHPLIKDCATDVPSST